MTEPARTITGDPGRPEDYSFRVLLAVPEATTIPIFALGVEARRAEIENNITFSTRESLAQVMSGNLSRAIPKRHGEHRLIKTRRRLGQRTAIYSSWLAFRKLAQAEALAAEHPFFGLVAIETTTRSKLLIREQHLKRAAANGRFNLGPLEHRARLNRAKAYVSESEALGKLHEQLAAMARLRLSLGEHPDGVSVG